MCLDIGKDVLTFRRNDGLGFFYSGAYSFGFSDDSENCDDGGDDDDDDEDDDDEDENGEDDEGDDDDEDYEDIQSSGMKELT